MSFLMTLGGGGASFAPSDLANLVLWLDAGQAGGVDGANLTSWPDRSSNAFDLNAQVAANVFHAAGGPNDKPYVTFSIGALYRASPLVAGADGARTCFVVTRRTSDGHICWLDGRYGFNGFGLAFGVSISGKREVSVSGVASAIDGNATGNWEDICIINAHLGLVANNQRMRVGGIAQTVTPSNSVEGASTAKFSLGGNDNGFAPDNYNGDIAEFIAYSRVLSDADIAKVEAYLLAKYGV